MLGIRRSATLLALAVLPLAGATTAPAHAVLDACVADLRLTATRTGGTGVEVRAVLYGDCPVAMGEGGLTCQVTLFGAPHGAESRTTYTFEWYGCLAPVIWDDAVQGTPYVAVATVTSPGALLPGTDTATIVA